MKFITFLEGLKIFYRKGLQTYNQLLSVSIFLCKSSIIYLLLLLFVSFRQDIDNAKAEELGKVFVSQILLETLIQSNAIQVLKQLAGQLEFGIVACVYIFMSRPRFLHQTSFLNARTSFLFFELKFP